MRLLAAVFVGTLAVTGVSGCGKKKGHSLGGGLTSGGTGGEHGIEVPSGMPSGLPSGIPSDVPTGYPTDGYTTYSPAPTYTTESPTYSPTPVYDESAFTETTTGTCDYDESSGMLTYDITVSNTDPSRSFRYTLKVEWTKKSDGAHMGSDTRYVTVLPNSSKTVTATAVHRLNTYTYFQCQLTSATKSSI
ncbi:hypothetical protein ACZ90_06765 [Streptomyces albus subsp. albus]|nr:hypothetical protein ACZ90_06765 [Streptomyces albus subsp. albus]